MNIEIANRLAKLRKEKGYSQEELAEKLGLSRQAVSKWERAESSPDTDNLICLAKLYNISLDELLKTEEDVETIKDSVKEQQERKKRKVNLSATGIYVENEDAIVSLSTRGILVKSLEDNEEVSIGQKPFDQLTEQEQKMRKITEKIEGAYSLLVVMAYIALGAVFDYWHPGWLLFLTIPIVSSFIEAIFNKNAHDFAFPILMALLFLVLGFYYDLWHPGWVVFILIPVYYAVIPGKPSIKINITDDDEEDN